jgi:hypothetical protein
VRHPLADGSSFKLGQIGYTRRVSARLDYHVTHVCFGATVKRGAVADVQQVVLINRSTRYGDLATVFGANEAPAIARTASLLHVIFYTPDHPAEQRAVK